MLSHLGTTLTGMGRDEVDRQVAAMAEGQNGLITRSQALGLGASAGMIDHRLRTARWEPATGRVYRVAGVPRSWQQSLLVAVLDAGDPALATGRSAAALWRVPGFAMGVPEVLVPRPSDHRPPLGVICETRHLEAHHRAVQQGVPVVTPARLMVELAATERQQRLERTIDSAIAAGILTPEGLAGAVAELCHRGRRGSGVLKALTLEILPGYVPPASELEARFRDLARTAGLADQMVLQANVGGEDWIGRVDVLFPATKLVVELDSRRWHTSRMASEADRRRTNALELAGWRVLQITWRRLLDDPIGVVHELRTLLRQAVAA